MGAGLHQLSSGPVVCAFWCWLLYDKGQHPWPPSKLSAHCPSEEAAKAKGDAGTTFKCRDNLGQTVSDVDES